LQTPSFRTQVPILPLSIVPAETANLPEGISKRVPKDPQAIAKIAECSHTAANQREL